MVVGQKSMVLLSEFCSTNLSQKERKVTTVTFKNGDLLYVLIFTLLCGGFSGAFLIHWSASDFVLGSLFGIIAFYLLMVEGKVTSYPLGKEETITVHIKGNPAERNLTHWSKIDEEDVLN